MPQKIRVSAINGRVNDRQIVERFLFLIGRYFF